MFKDLLGKIEATVPRANIQKPWNNPRYERLNQWIESRIGKMDPADPDLRTKLDGLLSREKGRFPSPQGRLIITRVGNDTVVSGDTRRFKGRLRSLGAKWDGRMRQWVAKDKQITEADFDTPAQLTGLKAYISTIPYRTNLGKGNP